MMKLHHILLLFAATFLLRVDSADSLPPFSCDSSNPSTKSLPFCNTSLPVSKRAIDLVSRLTLDEKISQLVNSAPAIPRLAIPSYEWWSEALHGVANVGKGINLQGQIKAATSFPQVILSAASFDANLWYRIGQVIGTEARAVYNAGQAKGMTFWAPNINIFRDPRWGRGQETPGEDPMVTGKYSVAYVRGVQGDSFEGGKLKNGQLQASACCKHFTAYDLDSWHGTTRFVFDAHVSAQDLADTYQPPFQSCIQQAKASGIMCAYNRVNGVPNCADYNLLSKTARAKWGFHGYITSDCDAVSIIHDSQGYAKTPEDAVVDVLKAGMDVDCGTYLQKYTKSAVHQRKLPISEIDRALRNLFSVRIRLGLFNGNPSQQPYGHISAGQVCSPQHQALAIEAARDGIVLLKNTAKLLPLRKGKTVSLAVIGPNANSVNTLQGNYYGPPCSNVTPLQALYTYAKSIEYQMACNSAACSAIRLQSAVNAARNADYVVLFMGLDQTQEKEELDRVDLGLPGQQEFLIKSVAEISKKPVILVIVSGGPVDISFAKISPKIGSILWAGYPGEGGGTALSQIIFGDHNPGGKLPMTWYPRSFVKVPMTDMRMRPDPSSGYPGRTYRFYKGATVYNFGYGLSYSNYAYKFTTVSHTTLYLNQSIAAMASNSYLYNDVSKLSTQICENNKVSVKVSVENQGKMAGKHPVLLFVRNENASIESPVKQLIGFQTVSLNAQERSEIEYEVSPCEHLTRANEEGLMVVQDGTYFLVVGDEEHPIRVIV